MNSRAQAARILAKIFAGQGNLDHGLQRIEQDKPFIQHLCYGVCRYYHSLHPMVQQLLNKPLTDDEILALIYLGLYQLHHENAESFAVVNECVEATKQLNKHWAGKLVNAVLRGFIRDKNSLFSEKQPLSATYHHPSWLIKKIKRAYPDAWQKILADNQKSPPMSLRVNQQKISRDDYQKLLAEQGIESAKSSLSNSGLNLFSPCSVSKLPKFSEGYCFVQSEAAQLAAELLEVKPKQRILDACAAPGGKTCHILEIDPGNEVIALDNHPQRAERITENLQRLGLTAKVQVADANDIANWWDKTPFDRILLDAPCSATGVIRRHPDIKLLRRARDIKPLQNLQLQLLTRLWKTLKPGGILLYATCSILPAENQDVITTFLSQQKDAELVSISKQAIGWQLLPKMGDGFYYGKLVKA